LRVNYAAFLLATGRIEEGEVAAKAALDMPTVPSRYELGLAFDLYADGKKESRERWLDLVALGLRKGTRCPEWSFALHLAQAAALGDRDCAALEALAAVVQGIKTPGVLARFPEFRRLGIIGSAIGPSRDGRSARNTKRHPSSRRRKDGKGRKRR
jgi:hypothetical protein